MGKRARAAWGSASGALLLSAGHCDGGRTLLPVVVSLRCSDCRVFPGVRDEEVGYSEYGTRGVGPLWASVPGLLGEAHLVRFCFSAGSSSAGSAFRGQGRRAGRQIPGRLPCRCVLMNCSGVPSRLHARRAAGRWRTEEDVLPQQAVVRELLVAAVLLSLSLESGQRAPDPIQGRECGRDRDWLAETRNGALGARPCR